MTERSTDRLGLNWLTNITVAIFVALLVLFAFYSRLGVSPDGLDHLDFTIHGIPGVNLIGPETEGFPVKYSHFYSTGYGYHYFLNLLYQPIKMFSAKSVYDNYWVVAPFLSEKKLLATTANLLLIIRILSVVFTCIQIYMLKKICELLELDWIYPVTLLWLSISIMYPFLHSNASRDVLVNMFSIAFVYNILAFHRHRMSGNVKYALLILAIAPFVQLSLCALLVTVLVSYAVFQPKSFMEMLNIIMQIIRLKHGYLFPVIFVLVALPATIDMSNKIIQYHSIKPGCKQMFSFSECKEKNATFKVYSYLKVAKAKRKRIDLFSYLKIWYPGVFMRIFGLMGHRSYICPNTLNYPLIGTISVFFLVSVFFAAKHFNKNKLMIGFISFIYFFIIFYFVNRKIYLFTGVVNAALQGRYVFPVYPLLVLFAHSFLGHCHRVVYYLYTTLLFGVLFYTYYLFFISSNVTQILIFF